MTEGEITRPLALDDRQSRLLDMHSVHNVLTVLLNQVAQIGAASGDLPSVAPIAHTLQTLRDGLADHTETILPPVHARARDPGGGRRGARGL